MLHKALQQSLVLSLLLSVATFALAVDNGPVVRVAAGELVGIPWPESHGATFRGVPFAQAPVGLLRWQAPLPAKPWSGQREAKEYGAPCAQVDGRWNSRDSRDGSEDCLYLNIDTPNLHPEKPMPVMVWIHGGANAGGSARGSVFPGNPLAMHGVVLVSVQYRLGLFGFMAHPELTKESGRNASGNYGLQDQVAALEWVRDNIAQFGGDPKQVTIFGQSAGAYDITLLMTSPRAKGLFAGAIEQSSPAIAGKRALPSLVQAEQRGVKLADTLHAPAQETIAYLRSVSTAEILKVSPPYGQGGLWAIVDGHVLPSDPAEVYARHKEHKVPVILGTNSREFPFFGNPDQLKPSIAEFFGQSAPTVLDIYGLSEKNAVSNPAYGTPGEQFSTDTIFRCHADVIADEHSVVAPTYQYEYSHPLPSRDQPGAIHSDELGYVAGTFFMAEPKETDRKVSSYFQEYWTNFAKTGDPNSASVPKWPAHDLKSRSYIEIASDGPHAKHNLRSEICPLYEAATAHQRGSGE